MPRGRSTKQSTTKTNKVNHDQEVIVNKKQPRRDGTTKSKESSKDEAVSQEPIVKNTSRGSTSKSKEYQNGRAKNETRSVKIEATRSGRLNRNARSARGETTKSEESKIKKTENKTCSVKIEATQSSVSKRKPTSAGEGIGKVKESQCDRSSVKIETTQQSQQKVTSSARGGTSKSKEGKHESSYFKVEASQPILPKRKIAAGARKTKEQNQNKQTTKVKEEACVSDESDFDMDSSPPCLKTNQKSKPGSVPDKNKRSKAKHSIVSPDKELSQASRGTKRRINNSGKGDKNIVVNKKEKVRKVEKIVENKRRSKIQQDVKDREEHLKKEVHQKDGVGGGDKDEASSDDSSESEWEEVEDLPLDLVDPAAAAGLNENDSLKEPLEISIDVDGGNTLRSRRKQKHEEMWRRYLQWQVNRSSKELQEALHKVHLLCLLSSGLQVSNLCNNVELQCIAMSHIPGILMPRKKGKADSYYLPKFVKWFRSSFSIDAELRDNPSHSMQMKLTRRLETKKAAKGIELVHICILMLRALGLDVRLVISLQAITIKAIKLTKASKKRLSKSKERKQSSSSSQEEKSKKAAKNAKIPHSNATPVCSKFFPSSDDKPSHSNTTAKQKTKLCSKEEKKTNKSENSTQESKPITNCELSKPKGPQPKNRARRKCASKVKPIIELSSDEENPSSDDDQMVGSDDDSSISEESGTRTKSSRKKPKQNSSVSNKRKQKSTGINNKTKKLKTQSAGNSSVEEIDSGSDFEAEVIRLASGPRSSSSSGDGSSSKKTSTKMVSSDSEESVEIIKTKGNVGQKGMDQWLEVYCAESGWICVDCIHGNIKRPQMLESKASKPTVYIVSFDNEGSIKDVTRRYDSKWMIGTQKLRVDPEWWDETLEPYITPNKARDRQEEDLLNGKLLNKPLPTTITEYKSHPLYALKRHLLKFEALYPETPAVLGYCRGEPVYARECVRELHTRQTWLKQARVVRIGEKPYKIVKARPKRNQPMETEPSLEIYGHWQTEDYIPPIAVDGVVPRNEHGNVELFKECMLPSRTVHLRFAGLNRIARKLDIDCAPAMTGWDFHGGFCHPVLDGYVVCEEYEEVLTEAWHNEQQEIEKRQRKKKEDRALKNWKLLIKGVWIRERLNKRFQTSQGAGTSSMNDKNDEKVSWPKNRLTAFEGDKNNRLPFETL